MKPKRDLEKQREHSRRWREKPENAAKAAAWTKKWKEKNKKRYKDWTQKYNQAYYKKNRARILKIREVKYRADSTNKIPTTKMSDEDKALKKTEYNRAYAAYRRHGDNQPLALWRKKWGGKQKKGQL